MAVVAEAARLGDLPEDSPLDGQRGWVLARLAERVSGG